MKITDYYTTYHIYNDFVSPPPWKLGEDDDLDIAYIKVMRELYKYGYDISEKEKLISEENVTCAICGKEIYLKDVFTIWVTGDQKYYICSYKCFKERLNGNKTNT